MDQLMTIGEFSALCQLSVKMLRHYDDIGLLAPARVDPATGYRFYSIEQARLATSIRELRALDMPLGEIRDVVEAGSAATTRDLLSRHRQRLARQLVDAERRIALIENLLGKEHAMIEDIREMDLPTLRVATRAVEGPTSMFLPLITTAFGELFVSLRQEGVEPIGPPIQIVSHGDEERFEHEACFPIDPAAEVSSAVAVRELPSTRAAVVRHSGPLDEGNLVVHSIFGWLHGRGQQPLMPFRVALLAIPPLFNPPEFAELTEPLVEISVPYRCPAGQKST